MEKNIVIKFTGDTTGLKEASDELQFVTSMDEALQKQAKKTAEEFKKQDAAINQSAKSFASNIGALSNSFANLTKVQIGDVLNKSLANVSKQAGLTGKDLISFYANIKKEANLRILGGTAGKDLEALKAVIVQADKALANLGATEEKVTQKSQSFRSQLRQIREELAAMEDAGLEGTQAFEDLQISAGRLQDQIGDTSARIQALSSDTFVFDALASGLQGVTGAFAVAQGAAALFGSENEDLQKALVKVQAALSIIQGVTAVINVLQKQSAASIALDILLRRNQAAAAQVQAVAQGELAAAITAETVVTEGAAVATGALNTVLNLNPAVLLITAITALAGAMYYFANSEDDAKENAETLNKALLDQLDIEQKLEKATNDYIAASNRDLTNKLTYDQAAKKSKQELFKDEVAIADQRSKFAAIDREANMEGILNLEEYRRKYEAAGRAIQDFNKQLEVDPARKEQIEEAKKTTQTIFDLNKQQFDKYNAYDQEYFNSNRDLNAKRLEIEQYTNEQALKSASAFAEARVLLARVGTAQEFNARRALLAAQQREELANADLTAGEVSRIKAKYQKENRELDREQALRALQITKAGIDDQVILAKEGSKERLDFEIASIEQQLKIDLAATGLSEKEKARLRDAARATEREKMRAFNQKTAEDAINTRIADINTRLSTLQLQNVRETNEEVITLKEQLIDEQGRLEIIGLENSERNEELRAAKIKAVYAKELEAKQELERQKVLAESEAQLDAKNNPIKAQIERTNFLLQLENQTDEQRRRSREKNAQDTLKVAENEREALNRLSVAGAINFRDYQAKLTEIEKNESEARAELQNTAIERQQAIFQAAQEVLQAGISAFFEINQQQYANDLSAAQELYDKKLISEQEYNNRVRDVKRRQAQADKQAAVFNIFLSTAQNIAKAAPNVVLIALAASLGAIQTAAVLAKPLPAYKSGKIKIDGPGSETSDDIVARLSKNESVINAKATRENEKALRAINEHRFQQYLIEHEMPRLIDLVGGVRLPQLPAGVEKLINSSSKVVGINHKELAKEIGLVVANQLKRMPKSRDVSVSIDRNGIFSIYTDGLKRETYTNNKLNR